MENIFDYSPNESELLRIFGRVWSRNEYLSVISHQQAADVDLWRLFFIRGEVGKAEFYYTRINHPILKKDLPLLVHEYN